MQTHLLLTLIRVHHINHNSIRLVVLQLILHCTKFNSIVNTMSQAQSPVGLSCLPLLQSWTLHILTPPLIELRA